MPARYPDWSTRLNAYIKSRREAAFSWGVNDCGKFAFGAVEVMSGKTCPRDWSSEEEARAIIEEFGTVNKFLTSIFGRSRGVLCARRGDIVADAKGALGIALGNRVATVSPQGFVLAPLTSFKRSWRVD